MKLGLEKLVLFVYIKNHIEVNMDRTVSVHSHLLHI